MALVCWLCGESHEECVSTFASRQAKIGGDWEHLGVALSAVKPTAYVWVTLGTPHGVLWLYKCVGCFATRTGFFGEKIPGVDSI